jgi:NAD(P)-dependent dehydrogenase (short-subunit alcohol dehydrogenase family)
MKENHMKRFTDKIVVITGGSSGIGLASAVEFLREGATVVVTGRTDDALSAAAKTLGGTAVAIKADVTKASDMEALFKQVKSKFGRIDVLFANAGIAKLGSIEETDEPLLADMMDTNFMGAFFAAKSALPLLSDGGAIVFTTSFFVDVGLAGTSAVSASKAALRSLTRTLATELLPRNIRVNAVSPGVIATPLFDKLGLPKETVDAIGAGLLATLPAKRFGTPEEVAKAVVFLASSDASYINGIALPVDGGRTQL